MKIFKLLVLSCFCWSLLGGIGFAEKSEFKDVNYSFAKLKSIPVTCMIDNDAQKFIENEYADKVVLQSLLENAKKKLVPLLDSYGLEKQYALLHSDYVEQKNKDEAKAQAVLAQYLKNNFDANLTVVVKKYYYDYPKDFSTDPDQIIQLRYNPQKPSSRLAKSQEHFVIFPQHCLC